MIVAVRTPTPPDELAAHMKTHLAWGDNASPQYMAAIDRRSKSAQRSHWSVADVRDIRWAIGLPEPDNVPDGRAHRNRPVANDQSTMPDADRLLRNQATATAHAGAAWSQAGIRARQSQAAAPEPDAPQVSPRPDIAALQESMAAMQRTVTQLASLVASLAGLQPPPSSPAAANQDSNSAAIVSMRQEIEELRRHATETSSLRQQIADMKRTLVESNALRQEVADLRRRADEAAQLRSMLAERDAEIARLREADINRQRAEISQQATISSLFASPSDVVSPSVAEALQAAIDATQLPLPDDSQDGSDFDMQRPAVRPSSSPPQDTTRTKKAKTRATELQGSTGQQ